MSWLSRIRNTIGGRQLTSEIDREMAFHIAERTDDLVAAGVSPADARSQARRQFGNMTNQQERTRERDTFAPLDALLGDIRYGLRALRAAPVFATVAILSLALGIGANTAIFTLVNAVMLKALPVSHPEELVMLKHHDANNYFTNPLWEEIRDRQDMFSGALAVGGASFNLAQGGEARPAAGNWVSGAFFTTLGVRAALGRTLLPSDDKRGCGGVAVLGHAFWQSEYGGSVSVIGKTISLSGHPFQIVGVAQPGFSGVDVGERVQIYAPLCAEAILSGSSSGLDGRSYWWLRIIGRPKPGITEAGVRARLAHIAPGIFARTVAQHWPAASVAEHLKGTLTAEPVPKGFSNVREQYGKALVVLMSIVGLVLLIACANVANLLLARATARQREIAVRLALGAGRARLVRQLLVESLLLASLGALLGVAFASWGSRLLVALMSNSDQPVALDLTLDMRVLAFTLAVTVATAVFFGLAPAWRASRTNPQVALKAHARGLTHGHSRFTVGRLLVVGQIALSLALVSGAALLLGSWRRLDTVSTGFDREHVLLVRLNLRPAGIPDSQYAAVYHRALASVRGVAGVRRASMSELTPVGRSSWNEGVDVPGFTSKGPMDAVVWMNEVSDGYFATLGTRIVAGRDFDHRDVVGSPKVALINETMARKFFGAASPIGRTYRTREGKGMSAPIEVIGIVGDTKYLSLDEKPQSIAYYATSQNKKPGASTNIEVLTDEPAAAVSASIKASLLEISPRVSLQFTTLDRQLAESLTLPRALATLSGFFGALALLLATIGLYGIMSYTVARRRGEIGVRLALGAAQSRVVRLVLAESGHMVIAGVVIGIAITLSASRLVASFLYGVEPSDPSTLAASAAILAAVALGAGAVPAWRASRLDPVMAMREE